MVLALVGILVFFINLPFGYWRSKVKKFSFSWFLAVHLSVPIIYALRIYAGIGWYLTTFPVLIGAFFLGQYMGYKYVRE